MSKKIKFNLICDGQPVRTLEDLQDNFSIEDVLSYFKNGLLHRWLEARGYEKELENVNAIKTENQIEAAKRLVKVFGVSLDDAEIEKYMYILQYSEQRKELLAKYENENFQVEKIMNDYENGYEMLVNDILENANNAAKIKADIAEIMENYKWIFKLNHIELFWEILEKSTLAVMCLLMNERSRNYYLPVLKKNEDGTVTLDTEYDSDKFEMFEGYRNAMDKSEMFDAICDTILFKDFKTELGDNLFVYKGQTDGYWKDIKTKDKKYMIISMEEGNFVRSAGLSGGDLSSGAISNKFVILDGIDYKSNSDTDELLFMEV